MRMHINWGEPAVSRKEYDIPTENGGCQKDDRQSDNFIVLLKSGNADRGKEVT